jgi:hypothetical protein
MRNGIAIIRSGSRGQFGSVNLGTPPGGGTPGQATFEKRSEPADVLAAALACLEIETFLVPAGETSAPDSRLTREKLLPIDLILEHRWLLIDVDEPRLRSFLLDLPAHRGPRTKLAGRLAGLTRMPPVAARDHAFRHDILFGNLAELQTMLESDDPDTAMGLAIREMRGTACRAVYLRRGEGGSVVLRQDGPVHQPAFPAQTVDKLGIEEDVFVAGCLWGIIENQDDQTVLERGNAAVAWASQVPGDPAWLPNRRQVIEMIAERSRRC